MLCGVRLKDGLAMGADGKSRGSPPSLPSVFVGPLPGLPPFPSIHCCLPPLLTGLLVLRVANLEAGLVGLGSSGSLHSDFVFSALTQYVWSLNFNSQRTIEFYFLLSSQEKPQWKPHMLLLIGSYKDIYG